MKIGNRKLIVVITLLLTINIYAVTLEQRLIDKSTQKEAIKELWDKGDTAVLELKEMLKSSNREMREIALVRIVNLKSKNFIEEAKEIIRTEKEFEVRKLAIQYLCLIKEKSIFLELKQMLTAGNRDEKYYAIKSIGYIYNSDDAEYAEAVKILEKEFTNQTDDEMKIETAFQLAKLNSDKGYETAVLLTKSNNPIIREKAIETLGEIGKPEAMQYIETALKDSEVWVRTKATVAKEKLELVSTVMPQGRKVSMRKMKKETKENKVKKLRKILNSDKSLDVKIWAANEILDMGEEGRITVDEIIAKNEKGSYVLVKEKNNRQGK